MKELKTYISEGFFSNVGADNRIKLVIDTIKDASINDKINSRERKPELIDSLTSILKNIESLIKKGVFVFKYTRNDGTRQNELITISFKRSGPNDTSWNWNYSAGYLASVRWTSNTKKGVKWSAVDIARRITDDLYCEAEYKLRDSNLHHSIANTIEVVEFKLS